MKHFLRSLFLLLLVAAKVTGQERTVTGTVRDKEGPLPGVSIRIKGSQTGTVTDPEGKFTIQATASSTLTFTYIGYTTQEIGVGEKATIDVVMTAAPNQLGEVVVTALGLERTKNELPFAAQKVEGESISKTRDANFVNSLSGKVAGLDIKRNNTLGGSTNVVIRGSKSITGNNQALFVIDGVPVDNANTNTNGQRQGGAGYDYGNAAADVNPDDIQSVNVLKGAAATALYGSRAANGVVVITTKKAKRGFNAVVNIGGSTGSIDKSTFVKYQKEYGAGYGPFYGPDGDAFFQQDDVNGDGVQDLIVPTTEDASFGGRYDPNLLVYDWSSFDPSSPNYQQPRPWVAAQNDPLSFFENPTSLNTSFAIDGASDKGGFKLGYTRNSDEGILPNSRVKKDIVNFGGSYNLSDKLTFDASINYSKIRGLGRYGSGYDAYNVATNFRQWWQTNVDVNEQRNAYFRGESNVTWNPNGFDDPFPAYWDNPYYVRYESFQNDGRDRYFGIASLNYKATDWLDIIGRISLDNYTEKQEERFGFQSINIPGYTLLRRTWQEYNYDLLLNFNKSFDQFTLKGTLGSNIRRSYEESIRQSTNGGIVVPDLYALSNSLNQLNPPTERFARIGVDGIFASATLGYKDMLFLDLQGRRDQSTTLAPGNNIYYYPSVAGSFVFSSLLEQQSNWLSYGKLRLNYAEVGNDAPALSLYDTYTKSANFGSAPIFSVNDIKNNPDLKPERTKSLEGGVELQFFNNRLGLDFSYYKTNTTEQILPITVSGATGNLVKYINSGEVRNQGIEFALTGSPFRSPEFSWDIGVNFTRNRNEVLSLFTNADGTPVTNLVLGSFQGGVTINATVGQPYGTIRGSDFVYTNGEKTLDGGYYQFSPTSDVVIGNSNPDWLGGVSNNFRYKQVSLGFLVDVRKGGDVFSLDQYYGLATGVGIATVGNNDLGNPKRNTIDEGGGVILEGVNPDGSANSTRVEVNDPNFGPAYGYANTPAKGFVYDGSYVKLRELTLGYALPSSVVEKLRGVKGIDLSLFGRNLWIIHKNLPDADPEDQISAGNLQGYQVGSYPTARTYGLNLKFRF